MKKHMVKIQILVILGLWVVLTAAAWLKPPTDFSYSERRYLDKFPTLSLESLDKGTFMKDFEDYTLDQFPLRDDFRTLKALAAFGLFAQKDNNDIYLVGGQAASLNYPYNPTSAEYAKGRFQYIMEKFFTDSTANFYFSIVPDKSYFLAEAGGYPVMDYSLLVNDYKEIFSFAQYIDIMDTLSADKYYATDSHWKQEHLLPTAEKLAVAMGIKDSIWTEYSVKQTSVPFYGVYYGQAALPLQPDRIQYLTNDLLEACTVYNWEKKETTGIYNLSKLDSRDPYEVFLSGATPLLFIDNPNAQNDKELVVFRDSYGSSLIPLLTGAYSRITVVDTRYIHPDMLADEVDFSSADDVLFLYSTTILNSSRSLR